MKKAKYLSLTELEKMGSNISGVYKFDISRISSDQYTSWLRSILHYSDSFKGLKFCLDLAETISRKRNFTNKNGSRGDKLGQSRQPLPVALDNSAMTRLPNASKDLYSTVSKLITRAKEFEFLKFRNIQCTFSDIDTLSASIFQSSTIRKLHFCDVNMGDAGFERLCRALRKRSVTDLQCRKCGLTDKSAGPFRSLLQFQPFLQYEFSWEDSLISDAPTGATSVVCLQRFDLRDNLFTSQFIDDVKDALYFENFSLIDLRGNFGISEAIILPVRKEIQQLNKKAPTKINIKILVGLSALPKESKLMERKIASSKKHPQKTANSEPLSKIKLLEEENRQLKYVIDCLQNHTNIETLEPGLDIVGSQAPQLVSHIRTLDNFLITSTNGPQPFLMESKVLKRNKPEPVQSQEPVQNSIKPKKRGQSVSNVKPDSISKNDSYKPKSKTPKKKLVKSQNMNGNLW